MPPLVVDVITAHKQALLNQEREQMEAMAQQWRRVEDALQDRVELFARRVADDNLTPGQLQSRRFQLDRYQSLLEQVRTELDKYTNYAEALITDRQRSLAGSAITQAGQAIRAVATEAGLRIAFDVLPIGAVENMVGLAGDGSPLRDLLLGSYGAAVDGMLNQLIQATAQGQNPQVTARAMVRQGLSQSLNSMMVTARTEQLRVFRESSRMAYQASGVVSGYRRLATKDGRTCSGCLMADGEFYELDEPLREHPQGRCTPLPIVEGMPPVQWERGPDWFRRQSPDVQRSILGKGRFEAWQDGKFDLDQLATVRQNAIWGDSIQSTPLRDLINGSAKSVDIRESEITQVSPEYVRSLNRDDALRELSDIASRIRQADEDGNEDLADMLRENQRVYLAILEVRRASNELAKISSDRLSVIIESDGEISQKHLRDYNLIPLDLRNVVEGRGVKVYINNDKAMPYIDEQQAFRGVRPRGWPDGMTWDDVAGAYNSEDRYVIAGDGKSGSISLILHEYGHSIGHVLQYDNDTRLIELHRQQYNRLADYYRQDGPGGPIGRKEFLAESFAHALIDRVEAANLYGQDMVDFIENIVMVAGEAIVR